MSPIYFKGKSALENYFYSNSLSQRRRDFCCCKFKLLSQAWQYTLAILQLGRLKQGDHGLEAGIHGLYSQSLLSILNENKTKAQCVTN